MNSTRGEHFRISVFGESHGDGIGVVIDGLPPKQELDLDAIKLELARRAPGQNVNTTSRREADDFVIYSGLFNGKTTGAPLMAFCRNTDTRSHDYEPEFPRPGHADYVAQNKFIESNDYRGGGHFSGRLTAPIVFAGAIAKQLLKVWNIEPKAKIVSIHGESDSSKFDAIIGEARERGDSVGGIINCTAENLLGGWGKPIFHSLESDISAMMFSIPAVKGIEFGDGFGFADKYGSEVSDGMEIDSDGNLAFLANHNGGINGGIANGQQLSFNVVFKPTPTIAIPQKTVNLKTWESVTHSFSGRHDPCIVQRALPVAEAALAIVLAEYILID
ncbi:MAG: chorismate synthase [Oscillospiraceae bacterium]|jgi:chorismate synthase|nr:chorismate synthase [Oscillospiraceae bacterium]